jgi:hypothetical protein
MNERPLFDRLLDAGFGYLGKDHFLGQLLILTSVAELGPPDKVITMEDQS